MRDRLSLAVTGRSAQAAASGAFEVLNGVQNIQHPADQLLGLACAFKAFAEVTGFKPAELFEVISRMERDCRFRNVNTLSAVRKYVEGEVKEKLL